MKPKHIIYWVECGENAYRDSTIYYVDEIQKNLGDPKENVDVYYKWKKSIWVPTGQYQICWQRIIEMETWSLLGARNSVFQH